ncbi:MAG: hypothetical protein BZY87_03660 [SAR202 cluster bacterium Io17-Chloro-G6]|nr:MAG: hypothetical protein BZY87_03660 [SAR202 cluster bacterium Io17-Chloro-G6]
MFYFKGCTKCQGDLSLEKDAYGDFLKCMQCGTLIEVAVEFTGHGSLLHQAGAQVLSRVRKKTAVAA